MFLAQLDWHILSEVSRYRRKQNCNVYDNKNIKNGNMSRLLYLLDNNLYFLLLSIMTTAVALNTELRVMLFVANTTPGESLVWGHMSLSDNDPEYSNQKSLDGKSVSFCVMSGAF